MSDDTPDPDQTRAVLAAAIRDLDGEHYPMWVNPGPRRGYTDTPVEGKEPVGCAMCYPGDSHWPCTSRDVADDLRKLLP